MAKRAVILEPEERKQRAALQMLSTIHRDKSSKRSVADKVSSHIVGSFYLHFIFLKRGYFFQTHTLGEIGEENGRGS